MPAPIALAATTHYITFLFYYPTTRNTGFGKGVMIVLYAGAVAALLYQVFGVISEPYVFKFTGNFWDRDAEAVYRHVSLQVLFYFFIATVLSIWRVLSAGRGEKLKMAGILIGFISATIIPGIFNALSRDGMVERSWYQTSTVLANLIGFFILVVVYLNTTRDRTTFMAKIVGISILTLLLAMQVAGFYWTSGRDSAYDDIRNRDLISITKTGNADDSAAYVAVFDPEEDSLSMMAGSEQQIHVSEVRPQLLNTYALHAVRKSPQPGEMIKELKESYPTTAAYMQYMLQHLSENPDADGEALVRHLQNNMRMIRYRTNKLLGLPDEGFAESAKEYLKKHEATFQGYGSSISSQISRMQSEGLSDAEIKTGLEAYMSPIHPEGKRHYRGKYSQPAEDGSVHHYVAYMKVDNNRIYEAGFPYLDYRSYMHTAAVRITILIIATSLFVLVGFRIFFLGLLVRPLAGLTGALEKVNEGNLDVEVPVKVEDEIGFMSRSFNNMVSSIRNARAKLKDYADNLEAMVAERTDQLKKSLEDVQALKLQQDGDYFLTSLLIKPLSANRAISPTIDIDFVVMQKKKFEFRKYKEEIGGDLCSAHPITLQRNPFTVFLNGDAMGKSMQGAGGALVLGSVFESIITRTRYSSAAQNMSPERWLKNAFLELHKVFESFDGSMLISLIMAIIDDKTGLMYYINAEHPHTVLYRNRKAVFIEDESHFRKLGTTGLEGTLYIPTFQLEAGDVIVAGSDGRDDILTGHDDNGNRIINEDETIFLETVMEADGKLDRIVELTKSHGELTDDLSLLRLAYNGPSPADDRKEPGLVEVLKEARNLARSENWERALERLYDAQKSMPGNSRLDRELALVYFRLKDYENAADHALRYTLKRPAELDMIYLASQSLKRCGDMENAIEYGERVRLRQPWHVRNLIHLADLYLKEGNRKRATDLVNQALEYEPNNETAKRLNDKIEQSAAIAGSDD